MNNLKSLIHKRGTIKGKLTRIQGILQTIQPAEFESLKERYEKLPDILNDFEKIQFEIADARIQENGQDLEIKQHEDEDEAEEFEERYYKIRAEIRAKLNIVSTILPGANSSVNVMNTSRIKLPEIKLPSFGGDFEKWTGFKDSFEVTIHNKSYLSDVEKFQYLRGLLIDEAAKVVSALSTTSENYQEALKLLKAKYDDKKLIINTHLRELLNITEVFKANYITLNQLIIKIRSHTQALKVLGAPIEHWDMILIHIIANKLDFYTRSEWEKLVSAKSNDESPALKELLDYLTSRCQTLQIMSRDNFNQESSSKTGYKAEKKVSLTTTETPKCEHCNGDHFLYRCESFGKLSSQAKWDEVRRLWLCGNCLKKGHISKNCNSGPCRICSKYHNTVLHSNIKETKLPKGDENQEGLEGSNPATVGYSGQEETNEHLENKVLHCIQKPTTRVILSTAQVYVYDVENKPTKCRVLLDPGSQLNLVTKDLAQKLRLPLKDMNIPISGVNQSRVKAQNAITIKLDSMTNNFTATQDYLILSQITERLPQVQLNLTTLRIPDYIQLADPEFNVPGNIDMLIGAGLFWKLLSLGQIALAKGQPVCQKTLLGWIVGGEQIVRSSHQERRVCNLSIIPNIEKQIEKFWKIEELTKEEQFTPEEKYCEQQFITTYTRNPDGRFKVKLPQNPEVKLGSSEKEAARRFYALEGRLTRNEDLREKYTNFLEEYENSGHMSRVIITTIPETEEVFYLPHHPVIREESTTTKLRVVFDGSAKTSLGTSLNEKLLVGPNLQQEIIHIILRFRMHNYVITADIAQMFRQIEVNEQDRKLQRIIWRKYKEPHVKLYELNTVTYGTTCAPYLAMRCLRQLAVDDGKKYPLAAEALKRDFYMDDVLTGSSTIEETIKLQKQLNQLLLEGQFELRKWRANDARILEHLSEEKKEKKMLVMDKNEAVKTLGLLWESTKDIFKFSIKLKQSTTVTKRIILSSIAEIYDPMGFVGPVIMHAKVIMQELWALKLSWDESVPHSIYTNWKYYYNSLEKLNQLNIPRRVKSESEESFISLHGFGDASERGYGACIYIISYDEHEKANCSLLCSKSRVAPLKKVTLPRLELCAAVLVARLLDVVRKALDKEKFNEIVLWSDSTIVLHWLRTPSNQLKTFVANRVAEVQELTNDCTWRHVPSPDNPADILSRGSTADQLISNQLWWHGPEWLSYRAAWPENKIEIDETVSEKRAVMLLIVNSIMDGMKKFSSFVKLERVIAYCFRFYDNSKGKTNSGALTVEELKRANLSIIRMAQQESFPEDIQNLKREKELNSKSKILMLKPFLDEKGLIRVGGRLQRADLPETHKHPYLLPSQHFITSLIMRDKHLQMKHCGPENLLNAIRTFYWPISGRREARKITRSCIPCFKYNPKSNNTLMAELPESRVKGLERPFETTGVDYAGPLQMRESKRRGRIPINKAYIVVFTCFRTKAIHLELVTDLTTEAFLAALRRFVARRGLCQVLYSDNGTNFVGAERELREIYAFLTQKEEEISTKLSLQRITWKFIPPKAPHFGGLWEAAVKATKKHLYTVTRGLTYTYEEYYTLLVEIEAVLNSRPLTPLSSDPHDFSSLTPSNFLIGVSQLEVLTKDYTHVPDNHLSRWQHIQKIKQDFWNRWKKEYLHQLQARTKWAVGTENLKINTLVLLVEDNAAPLHWALGRVIQVHPGSDGVVRVATVKTSTGEFKRPVKKLCALPINNEKF